MGALPDSAMIVMSGLGGTVEQAKEQVAIKLLLKLLPKHTQVAIKLLLKLLPCVS